jgi:hypothetical protein
MQEQGNRHGQPQSACRQRRLIAIAEAAFTSIDRLQQLVVGSLGGDSRRRQRFDIAAAEFERQIVDRLDVQRIS